VEIGRSEVREKDFNFYNRPVDRVDVDNTDGVILIVLRDVACEVVVGAVDVQTGNVVLPPYELNVVVDKRLHLTPLVELLPSLFP
jgi:hypothetical protein